ncbi:sporulation protein YunB [Bacillus spizizenii]|nr:sporulation protein YunB [Bacillus spizizenii]MCY7920233.1 sporulation protein YunB [Bacillus spizizenii]MCY8117226.1 sporulation protein YunB [Bacillus spizizenii]MCY8128258.1 sporulation protein YunB [Bacillus spizizenii]MCY8716494.1 sporulation protein YunB [Bacillus spizizenii]
MPRYRGPFRKRGPLPFRYVMLLSVVFFILSTTVSLWMINGSIKPVLMDIGEMETKRIATEVIQDSIEDYMSDSENMKDMFQMNSDENGNLTTIDFNTQVVNSVKTKVTKQLQAHLKEMETHSGHSGASENIMINIPLGQVTGNSLLGNLGPKIPVRFNLIGDAFTDVKTKIKPYGINNALIDISIFVEIKVKVIIPFASKTAVVTNNVPVSIKAVQGEVPQFYNGNGGSGVTPSVQLPSSKEEDSVESKKEKSSK